MSNPAFVNVTLPYDLSLALLEHLENSVRASGITASRTAAPLDDLVRRAMDEAHANQRASVERRLAAADEARAAAPKTRKRKTAAGRSP